MDGVLLVDKPKTWTSHDVCSFVKKRFRFKKVGHTGTLDPRASGLLILLINKMTKQAPLFQADSKDYEVLFQLGIETNTYDLDGDVVKQLSSENVTEEMIFDLPNQFKGELFQTPPMVSAKKVKGTPLYKLARQGKVIKREPVKVQLHEFHIKKMDLPSIEAFLSVSKGFYVRSLIHDIGQELGVGAAVDQLRRTRSGKFSIDNAYTIDQLREIEMEKITDWLVPSDAIQGLLEAS